MTKIFSPAHPDGLPTSQMGKWALRKHDLVVMYAKMFANSMFGKWARLFYVDLFSGPGIAKIESGDCCYTPPLRAISEIGDKMSYIFCDQKGDYCEALRARIRRLCPELESIITVMHGDSNSPQVHQKIADLITPRKKSLVFCHLDPYKVANLDFSMVRALARHSKVDFIVLLPTGMDAHRNIDLYSDPDHKSIERFSGNPNWRKNREHTMGKTPPVFLAHPFGESMEELGYLPVPDENLLPVCMSGTNRVLYHLALYSKSKLAEKFWAEAKKYTDSQRELF